METRTTQVDHENDADIILHLDWNPHDTSLVAQKLLRHAHNGDLAVTIVSDTEPMETKIKIMLNSVSAHRFIEGIGHYLIKRQQKARKQNRTITTTQLLIPHTDGQTNTDLTQYSDIAELTGPAQ